MLRGYSIINGESRQGSKGTFTGIDPATGAHLDPPYHYASLDDLNLAANLAEEAFAIYGKLPGREKAKFLRRIAAGIEAIATELVERAHRETALPEARLKGELARTVNQLRLFATVVEDGSWANARIDPAEPERKPLPRADIRSVLRPLGPVAVFGSSNFPLAFSVAGGDTASAFAAGNPVIVKAHSAHPGTSELVGQVIAESVRDCALPPGTFALLFGAGAEMGRALVAHPVIKAVGFTGSLSAGKSLMQVAAARPEPIPCFMEMSSANPLVVLPEALRARGPQIAQGLFNSFTLGVGQFCTKPGLVYLPRDAEADAFVSALKGHVEQSAAAPMLTDTICRNHHTGVAGRVAHERVEQLAEGVTRQEGGGAYATPALFQVSGADMLAEPDLANEIFGPSTLIIRYANAQELRTLLQALEGQLTATLHGTDADIAANNDLIAILERKAGRLIVNGFPTGVEVCHAMVHGGPYPATSESRMTSVGTQAIYRFVRPVCYQDFPQAALPDELKDENPLGIWRLINGQFTRDAVRAETPVAAATA
ncbi:MAG TPA: aldehyde dehydrogenase (NADP(+)) [Terracidiphilus sp.]|nr:aldehyde dehydrogenase (NADP(+)) [Terracidiphilus sp.]